MASPASYNVQFTFQNKTYSLDLVPTTSPQVALLTIRGMKYACLADEPQSQAVQEALKALSQVVVKSKEDLIKALRASKTISSISVTAKTASVAKKALSAKHGKPLPKATVAAKTAASSADKTHQTASRLIFLSGTSTAGKSSIMTEFAKRHENAVELGTDDFEEQHRAALIAKHFPKEYAILSQVIEDKKLFRFLFSPLDVIKKHPEEFFKNSPEPKTAAEKEALLALRNAALSLYETPFYKAVDVLLKKHKATQDEEHFKAILDLSAKGKTVIFDTPNAAGFLEYLKSHPHHAPVQRFLVYVPLTELVKRLPGRNEQAEATGNVYNRRQYIDLLNQFKHQYRKAEPAADIPVGTLKREDVEKIFKDNEQAIEAENMSARENSRAEQVVVKDQFLKYFGLDAQSEVPITCDFQKFDGIFHTATQTAAASADQLSTHSWQHFKKK